MGKAQQLETRNRGSMHLNPNSKCNKRRIRWTTELHQRFEQAVAALGGAACATPKGILERMKAPEVTIMHVKSHLQKYRLTLTSDGSGQHKYSGSDEHVSFQDRPSRCLGLGAHADVYGDEDEFGVARDNVRMELADVDNKLAEAADVQQPSALPDNAARKKLVDTVVQQHTMQEELKHQIRVQTELYKNLQNQHTLLQQHFMSQAFQQQQQQMFSQYPMQMRMQDFHPHPQ